VAAEDLISIHVHDYTSHDIAICSNNLIWNMAIYILLLILIVIRAHPYTHFILFPLGGGSSVSRHSKAIEPIHATNPGMKVSLSPFNFL